MRFYILHMKIIQIKIYTVHIASHLNAKHLLLMFGHHFTNWSSTKIVDLTRIRLWCRFDTHNLSILSRIIFCVEINDFNSFFAFVVAFYFSYDTIRFSVSFDIKLFLFSSSSCFKFNSTAATTTTTWIFS